MWRNIKSRVEDSTLKTVTTLKLLSNDSAVREYIAGEIVAYCDNLPSDYYLIRDCGLGNGYYFQDRMYLAVNASNIVLPAMYRGKDLKKCEGYCKGIPDVVVDIYQDQSNLKYLDYKTKLYQELGVKSIFNVILTKNFVEFWVKNGKCYKFSIELLDSWNGVC